MTFFTIPIPIGRQDVLIALSFLLGGVEFVEIKKRLQKIPQRKQIPGKENYPQEEKAEALPGRFGGTGRRNPKLRSADGVP